MNVKKDDIPRGVGSGEMLEIEENIMTREKATSIVNKFFKDMNPTFWNGEGEKPSSFKVIPWQYPLTDEVNLEITFVCDDEDDWHHCCDLVCSSDNSSFDMLSGYGIDSPLNLIDTIEDLCRDYGENIDLLGSTVAGFGRKSKPENW